MKISFLDFWSAPGGFDPTNNFFYYALCEVFDDIQYVYPEDAELIIFSCFGNDNTRFNHCKKLFYTGENIRPNKKRCNYSMSFDFDDYNKTNIRFPLWMMHIDWFKKGTYLNPEYLVPEEYLYGKNEFNLKEKTKFCSTVFSSLYQHRVDAVNKLSNYKGVDVYGKSGGIPLSDGEKNKLDVISDYKFSICFENDSYPGYITEKLFHAKVSGSLPIYYGDETFKNDFNEKCCLNAKEMTLDELYQKVVELDNDEKKYQQILDEPMFNEKITLEPILKQMYEVIKI